VSIDNWVKLLGVLVSLLQVVVWPLIVLLVLSFLGKPIKNYLDELRKDKGVSEVNVEAGATGVKLNIKREVEVATNLSLAVKKWEPTEASEASGESLPSEARTQEVLNTVSKAATSQTVQQVAGARVLWVDDNHVNNYYERSALEALGIQFTLSKSTEDGLKKARTKSYAAIISDQARPSDQQAGYTLLEALHKEGITTPFILYSSSNRPEHKAEIIRRGGFGTTNSPQELFQLVIDAIQQS
jgi:CheY-like chemotaxis protein